jgi:hypothetical protein
MIQSSTVFLPLPAAGCSTRRAIHHQRRYLGRHAWLGLSVKGETVPDSRAQKAKTESRNETWGIGQGPVAGRLGWHCRIRAPSQTIGPSDGAGRERDPRRHPLIPGNRERGLTRRSHHVAERHRHSVGPSHVRGLTLDTSAPAPHARRHWGWHWDVFLHVCTSMLVKILCCYALRS